MASLKINLLVVSIAVLCVYVVYEISAESAHCRYHRHTTWDYRVKNSTHVKYYYRVYYGICNSTGNLVLDLRVSVNGEPLYYTITYSLQKRSTEADDESFEERERNSVGEERQTKSAEV
ncbi:uncharacterized protein LOC133176421 [Saccostrea echinata]|uniref:uncharacterized protein LOC133176421 n=1 Tax=Saccostrea echinata TaxID=191078 RepID=UPI002A82887A|nr:uncharacterized protein LOC133176421 [Saccostrea echinata]